MTDTARLEMLPRRWVSTNFRIFRMKPSRSIWNALFGAFLFVFAACGRGNAPVHELRMSVILGTNSTWYSGAKRFADLVEERTGGKYHITVYPHAQLAGGVQRTELEMVQTGVIDLSLESSILLSLLEERMAVLSLPWMFEDYAGADSLLCGPLGNELLGLLPAENIVGLAYGANGFRQITNSRNPILVPDDLADMKVRIPAIRLYIDIFKQLGADPSSMNFGELFPALAQKTMDGQENPAVVIFSSRLYEVQKYLTVWNYSYDPLVLCMNRNRWNTLSPDTRAVFLECAREAMHEEFHLVADGESAAYDSLRAKGMVIDSLSPASLGRFRAASEPVYAAYARAVGADFVRRFRSAAGEGVHK